MVVFHSDLDNTLIFSYKHDIGKRKRCAEIYQGREISFVTERTASLLTQAADAVLLVPTTTRTQEQYERIDLGIGTPEYALVCNGGVLLVNGEEDPEWYRESLERVKDCREELAKAQEILQKDSFRNFEVRNIRELFLFTKSADPERTVKGLKEKVDAGRIDVFSNGAKVYAVPVKLNKGEAVQRFRQRVNAEKVLAAGDSEFDLPMLEAADIGIAPEELAKRHEMGSHVIAMKGDRVFSECALEKVLECL